jgi:tetratricopeptide (TPR) repeat protein
MARITGEVKVLPQDYQKRPKPSIALGAIACLWILIFPLLSKDNQEEILLEDFVLDLAALYLNANEPEEAIDLLTQLRDIYPENYDIGLCTGIAYYKMEEYSSALKEFEKIEKALDSVSKFMHARPQPGRFYWEPEEFVFSPQNIGLLHFAKGVTLLHLQSDLKTAQKKINLALKKGYEDIRARHLLISAYIQLDNFNKAEKELNFLAQQKHMDESFYFLKGYVCLKKNRDKDALFCFEKALKLDPSFLEAEKNLARLFYNQGDWERAIELWSAVIVKTKRDRESHLNIGRAYFYLGQLEEARSMFKRLNITIPAEKYSPKKLSLCRIPWEKWAKIDIQHKVDYEAFLKNKYRGKFGVEKIRPAQQAAFFLAEKALFILKSTGDIKKAIQLNELANRIDRTNSFVSYNLAQLYFHLGDLHKSKDYALLAIQHETDFLEAVDLLGNIYFMQGKYEEAATKFRKVVEISKNDAQGYYNLGCAYSVLKKLQEAENALKQAIQYDTNKVKNKQDKKYSQEGLDISITIRKKSVAYSAHLALGSLYTGQKRLEDAINEYLAAIAKDPDKAEAYFALGEIYLNKKFWEQAEYYLKKHIELGGGNQDEAGKMLKIIKNELRGFS